jgi:hypothetical protein
MIPTDLAARLRTLTESLVNPVSPVHEIPADLPELPIGQRFTARVENTLPDGTFRALVAGRSLTLALPQPAKPGDILELVVTARTPRLIVAEGAGETPANRMASPTSPTPTLSRAGQLIGALLAGNERGAQPAIVTRSAPLLPAPFPQSARLAPALQQAIVESGLFYEAHQAQWIAGRYPAEALSREPQARLAGKPQAPAAATAPAAAEELAAAERPQIAAPAAGRGATAGAPLLPAEFQTLVQQQLDAAATQHIVWRGEVWPGQPLHWEIEAEERRGDETGEVPAAQWTTRLGLTLPGLGEVKAALTLMPGKVSLDMTADAEHVGELRRGLGNLAAAFAAAGLPPLAAGVNPHESE